MATITAVYTAYAASRALAAPWNAWAAALHKMWSHPAFPMAGTGLGRAVASTSELVERATRRYPKPPFALPSTTIDGVPVAVREVVRVATPFCNLVHFERETARRDPKILLVAPLSGHHASLLRDTVLRLLPEHDLYVTDWIDARLVPAGAGPFDLDDYIALLPTFLRAIGPDAHAVAVCQPGVPLLAAVSLMAEANDPATPRTMTLMASPIDTRVSPTQVNKFATSHGRDWFERAAVHPVPFGEPGFSRRVYPGFLQLAAFVSMNPERHAQAHRELFRDALRGDEEGADARRRFYDDYLAVMDLPAEYYLQTISSVFQEHELARGTMLFRGAQAIRPAAIRETALLTIEGEKDDITGLGQTAAAHGLCAGMLQRNKERHVQEGAGHYGVFSGRRWREQIAPRLAAFVRAH